MSQTSDIQVNEQPKPLLKNRTYDFLKFVALIALPALGTLYYSLASIWHLPYASEVVGTIVSVDTFLGALLHVSTKTYENTDAKYDGQIDVVETPDTKQFQLQLFSDPDELDQKKDILFKVNNR